MKPVYLSIGAVALTALFLFCNIFNPTDRNKSEEYGAYALVIEGKKMMQEGDYENAISVFRSALAKDSTLSEAYFYLGKCILRKFDIDLTMVWDEVNPSDVDSNAVPFLYKSDDRGLMDSIPVYRAEIPYYDTNGTFEDKSYSAYTVIDSVFLERKRLYDAVSSSLPLLEEIHSRPDIDGRLQREQYEPDYLIEISIKTFIGGFVDVDSSGMLEWDERETFRLACSDFHSLDSLKMDSLSTIYRDPGIINGKIDWVLSNLLKADTSYGNFYADLIEGVEKGAEGIDTGMASGFGSMINDANSFLPFYYHNDGADNDSDYYDTNNNGVQDRMIWIDWDYDGKIDIDAAGTEHIGDSIHIEMNPELYEYIDTAGGHYRRFVYSGGYTYEFIAGDWGVDEEIMDGIDNDQDGMIDEDTRIVADTLDNDGDWHDNTDITLNDTCFNPMHWTDDDGDFRIDMPDTGWVMKPVKQELLSSAYLSHFNAPDSVRSFTGEPETGEYYTDRFPTPGDWGVDEEWYDGLDNDGDGMIDEDVGEMLPPEELREDLIDELRQAGMR